MSQMNIEFENLKKNIIRKVQHSVDLEKVKDCFSCIINSRRSLSRVKNLNDIFCLLEQRDILDCNNVSALEYLESLSRNQEVANLLRGYKKLYIDSESNVCHCGQDLTFSLPVVNPQRENSIENNTSGILELAFENIAMNIGKNWRVLASELKVPEHYVDEIRDKYPSDMCQQALKILQIWKRYNEEAATLDVLKGALESRLCKMKGIGVHMLKPMITV